MKQIIAVTCGDPAGIGPEVIMKALKSDELNQQVHFQVLGNWHDVTFGKPNAESARIALDALEESVQWLKSGRAAAVVTAPIAKSNLKSLGFTFPGQTEFYANAWGVSDYGMMFQGKLLTVGLVSIHVSLADAVRYLNSADIVKMGRLMASYLKKKLGHMPRIAVVGLNPHASEKGSFGNEEAQIIEPAIQELNSFQEAQFYGPCVPDVVFREALNGSYDAVLAMYHDQGLIPLKLIDFEHAVNVTLGLPKPRTSPDHGTAFDIAGKGVADHRSMLAAMNLAAEMIL